MDHDTRKFHPRYEGRLRHWRPFALAVGAVVALMLSLSPAARAQEPVDVELILAVDVSLSMSPKELEIQRDGYAAALADKEVIDAILGGAHGRIALTYFEWAGNETHNVIVPWTRIASRADAESVAARLTTEPPRSARRTSISGAMTFALDLFAESGYRGLKRIVDISGDGPNNQGRPVDVTRDILVQRGITINGLPLMTSGGVASAFDVDNLDIYYTECVIGGPGAFMIPVNDWAQFPEAVRRKLVTELARVEEAGPPHIVPAGVMNPYDCLVGEKMWDNRSWMWRDP